jgi:hypothetical protein
MIASLVVKTFLVVVVTVNVAHDAKVLQEQTIPIIVPTVLHMQGVLIKYVL